MFRKNQARRLAGLGLFREKRVTDYEFDASQITIGSISGTVKDPSGSVIPDTTVIAKNTDTGAEQKTVTNARAFYAFQSLRVGTYELDASRPGSKAYKRTGLVIDVNSKVQIDITNPQNNASLYYFNPLAFKDNVIGTLGNAS